MFSDRWKLQKMFNMKLLRLKTPCNQNVCRYFVSYERVTQRHNLNCLARLGLRAERRGAPEESESTVEAESALPEHALPS